MEVAKVNWFDIAFYVFMLASSVWLIISDIQLQRRMKRLRRLLDEVEERAK